MKTYSKKIACLCTFFSMIILSCIPPTLSYIGETYPPTENVQIYFREKDIPSEYKIIGKIVGIQENLLFREIQSFLIRRAKKNGADAIWVTNYTSGHSLSPSDSCSNINLNLDADNIVLDAYFLKYDFSL